MFTWRFNMQRANERHTRTPAQSQARRGRNRCRPKRVFHPTRLNAEKLEQLVADGPWLWPMLGSRYGRMKRRNKIRNNFNSSQSQFVWLWPRISTAAANPCCHRVSFRLKNETNRRPLRLDSDVGQFIRWHLGPELMHPNCNLKFVEHIERASLQRRLRFQIKKCRSFHFMRSGYRWLGQRWWWWWWRSNGWTRRKMKMQCHRWYRKGNDADDTFNGTRTSIRLKLNRFEFDTVIANKFTNPNLIRMCVCYWATHFPSSSWQFYALSIRLDDFSLQFGWLRLRAADNINLLFSKCIYCVHHVHGPPRMNVRQRNRSRRIASFPNMKLVCAHTTSDHATHELLWFHIFITQSMCVNSVNCSVVSAAVYVGHCRNMSYTRRGDYTPHLSVCVCWQWERVKRKTNKSME